MDYIYVSLIHKITTETCCMHMTCKWSPKETEKHPEKFVQGCFIALKGLHKAIYKKTGEKKEQVTMRSRVCILRVKLEGKGLLEA